MNKQENIEMNNNKRNEKDNKRTIILLLLYSISLITFILSGAFTLSTILNAQKADLNNIQVGQVQMDLINNDSTNINLVNAYPITYERAMKLNPFEFRVINNGTLSVVYRLKLLEIEKDEVNITLPNEKLSNDKVSYSLIDKDTNTIIKTGTIKDLDDGILITEKLQPKYYKNFEFRLWVNETAGDESQNKYYITKINLEIDEILK